MTQEGTARPAGKTLAGEFCKQNKTMKIGKITFENGDITQGWNPHLMTPKTRKQVAAELEAIAKHMRKDEFEVDGKFEHSPYKRRRKTK